MTKHDFILKMFTSDDELRPAMQKPGIRHDYVYATDAHACIRFPANLCEGDCSENVKFPPAENVYPGNGFENENELDVDDLLSQLYSCEFQFHKKYEDCKKCEGYGTIECECCNNESDCKECDGKGQTDYIPPFSGMQLRGTEVELCGKFLNPRFLYSALNVAYILREQTIKIQWPEDKPQVVFLIGEVEILVMSIYKGNK